MKKHLISSAMILALGATGASFSSSPVSANGHAGAAILGAIIGGAIVAGSNNNRRNNNAAPHNPAPSAQRTENREIQTALNYFNFPAGAPDGIVGRRTRGAISQYQAFMDFPVTGELSTFQKDFLLTSFQRAQLGGAETSRIILSDPDGTRGLLVSFMQQQGGPELGSTPLGGGTLAASDPAGDFASENGNESRPAGLPVFVTSQEASMNDLCISGIRPNSVEAQFCNLRAYAIDEGDRLAASVQGTSRADIEAQCAGFAPTLQPYVNTVARSNTSTAIYELQNWALSSGATENTLEGIAKTCLGVGYATDNPDVALASLMTLIGIGRGGYEELLAYHVALGFGFEGQADAERGAEWLDSASLAFAEGEAPITGESSNIRATIAITMANTMRGEPASTGNTGILPAFAPSQPAADNTGGGFFSTTGSN